MYIKIENLKETTHIKIETFCLPCQAFAKPNPYFPRIAATPSKSSFSALCASLIFPGRGPPAAPPCSWVCHSGGSSSSSSWPTPGVPVGGPRGLAGQGGGPAGYC